MAGFVHLLWTITVPIVVICMAGAWVARSHSLHVKTLSTVSLYVFSPALVLSTLPESSLGGGHAAKITAFTAIFTAACWLLAMACSRWFRLEPCVSRGLTLTTVFSNSNNYGLPVLLLAFGSNGFALGTLYVIGQIILVNVLGTYIASSGHGASAGLRTIIRSPLLYACAAGILLAMVHVSLPGGLGVAAKLLGQAYTMVLLILGIQLGRTSWSGIRRKDVWLGVGLRVFATPLIAKLVIWLLGIHGLLAAVLFVEASMPAAVNTVTLANMYDVDEQWVSVVVAITTALSFLYLPLIIALA
ncbi:MAG: AEC family transporter [Alicyclobacillus sp.]|nr:AEC family transporter [Alicyclobacillus sp.]